MGWCWASRPNVTVFMLSVVTTQGTPSRAPQQAIRQRSSVSERMSVVKRTHPAAVFEAGSEEIAGLTLETGAEQRKLTNFAPIDLEQFTGQALKANDNLRGERSPSTLERAHVHIQGGNTASVGMVGIGTGEFQHALDAKALVKPGEDLVMEDRHGAGAMTRGRLAVQGFAEHTGDGVTMMTDKGGNLRVGPAFLFEVVDSGTIHIP